MKTRISLKYFATDCRSDSFLGHTKKYFLKNCSSSCYSQWFDLSFVSGSLYEPNSFIKSSQMGIWKWRRKIPLLLSCSAENYSNSNFSEHEKTGKEIWELNWRFFLVNGKAKKTQKNSFQNITAVFSVTC